MASAICLSLLTSLHNGSNGCKSTMVNADAQGTMFHLYPFNADDITWYYYSYHADKSQYIFITLYLFHNSVFDAD
jgi:hypothetical protein